MDGKDRCFFQVMSCWCGQNLNSAVKPEAIQASLTGSRKNVPQVIMIHVFSVGSSAERFSQSVQHTGGRDRKERSRWQRKRERGATG
jgi:hypothetical protein